MWTSWRSFFYYSKTLIVKHSCFCWLLCRTYDPCSSEPLPESVQRIDLPIPEESLQTLFAHCQGKAGNLPSFAQKLVALVGLQQRQDFFEICRFHSDPKPAAIWNHAKRFLSKKLRLSKTCGQCCLDGHGDGSVDAAILVRLDVLSHENAVDSTCSQNWNPRRHRHENNHLQTVGCSCDAGWWPNVEKIDLGPQL